MRGAARDLDAGDHTADTWSRGREQQILLPADSGTRRRSASISSATCSPVEPVQVLDPEQRELAPSPSLDQLEKRPEKTCAACFGIESRRSSDVIGHPQKVEPEIQGDGVGLHVPETASHCVADVQR